MGTLTVNATNGQTVAKSASYLVPLPSGKSLGNYQTAGATITTSDGSVYPVTVSFGALGITVTNPTGRDIASGGFDFIDLQTAGILARFNASGETDVVIGPKNTEASLVTATVDPVSGYVIGQSVGDKSLPVPGTALFVGPSNITEKSSWSAHTKLFSASDTAAATVFWPWIIETSRITGALAKYYMYFSTDHSSGAGGIHMAYSNTIAGPWTQYGQVYIDTATTGIGQTETPSVIWDDENSRFIMYYQQFGAKWTTGDLTNAIGQQSTLACHSTNGITWTKDPYFILDVPDLTSQLGDGHTGYFMPFRTRRGWFGASVYGGTISSGAILWRNACGPLGGEVSDIARTGWTSDRCLLGYGADVVYNLLPAVWGSSDILRTMRFGNSFVVESGGVEYLIFAISVPVLYPTAQIQRIYIAPVSADYRTILDRPKLIWEPEASWDEVAGDGLHGMTPFVDGGTLYLVYSTAATHIGVTSHVI